MISTSSIYPLIGGLFYLLPVLTFSMLERESRVQSESAVSRGEKKAVAHHFADTYPAKIRSKYKHQTRKYYEPIRKSEALLSFRSCLFGICPMQHTPSLLPS